MKFRIAETKTMPIEKLLTKIKTEDPNWQHYIEGLCDWLACSLYSIYGGEIIALQKKLESTKGKITYDSHTHTVLFYKEKFWDISGGYDKEELLKLWGKELVIREVSFKDKIGEDGLKGFISKMQAFAKGKIEKPPLWNLPLSPHS